MVAMASPTLLMLRSMTAAKKIYAALYAAVESAA
jgi:hypothetical protein